MFATGKGFPRFAALCMVLVLPETYAAFSLAQGPPPPPFWIEGDIDGNGKVDNRDVRRFRQEWVKYHEGRTIDPNADINGDQRINYYDALRLLHLLLNPQAPPATSGLIVGTLQVQGNPEDYEALLDGVPVAWEIRADGSFGISGVPVGGHTLTVVRRGAPAEGVHVGVDVVGGDRIILPEPLKPVVAGQIAGIVSDGVAKTPIVGAQVVAVPADARFLADRTRETSRVVDEGGRDTISVPPPPAEDGAGVSPPPPPPRILQALTDANGAYTIPAVPPGIYMVAAIARGYLPQRKLTRVAAGRTSPADFQLRPRPEPVEPGIGTVEGTVYGLVADIAKGSLDQKPIQGAVVCVRPQRAITIPLTPPEPPVLTDVAQGADSDDIVPPPPPDLILPRLCTLTDREGHYSIDAPAGNALLVARADGYRPTFVGVVVVSGQTVKQDVTLRPARRAQ
jgi:hypothetical protein